MRMLSLSIACLDFREIPSHDLIATVSQSCAAHSYNSRE